MEVKNAKIKLNNGYQMPIVGLGTWKSKPGEVCKAVKDAIDIGYRHIDCAYLYENEKEIGEAISAKIKEGVVKREDLFIVSKLWNTFHQPDLVQKGFEETLENLGLKYLDLYLMHSPMAFKEGEGIYPKDPNDDSKIAFSDVDYIDTWKAMEQLVKKGLTKSIGISNFNHTQIERLLSKANITPVTNQIECHPYLNQQKMIDFCLSKGISVTAYSPLGSPDRPWATAGEIKLLDDPRVQKVAKRLNRSSGQVLLRFHIDRGVVVLPKSVNKDRLKSNFDILNFKLSETDLKELLSMDKGEAGRYIKWDIALEHKDYPFGSK